jgi:hypothetical protein
LKADRLEARARYLRALNPSEPVTPAVARKLLSYASNPEPVVPRRIVQFAKLMNAGKFQSRSPLLFNNGSLIDGRHRLSAVLVSGKPQQFAIERLGNPMHPLEIGSHLAMILSGVHTAGEMAKGAKKKKPRRPSATTAARRLAERKHGSVRGQTKIVKRKVRNGSSRKRNHGEIFEEFTGAPSDQVTTGYVAADAPKDVDQLTHDVVQLALETPYGKPVRIGSEQDGTARTIRGEVIRFNPGAVKICATTKNGKRRFVTTVRKEDRAKWMERNPGLTGNYKRGVVAEVVYRARKPHLYGHNRMLTFYHILGEEGGRRPQAVLKNGCPTLRYGDYDIRAEGIRN